MLKDQLPPCQGEHIGVLTPNIIAGLIANRLNLMGPSYIVDAACATTMIALESAVRELNSRRCALQPVGGSQEPPPPQSLLPVCRLHALSTSHHRPFPKRPDRPLTRQGAGWRVLTRTP